MTRAEAYSNVSLNETVIKFELDDKRGGGGNTELVIICDFINPIKDSNDVDRYNNDRSQIINEILPNLDIHKIPNVHLIYNGENGEAKYYYGNINSLRNLSLSEIALFNNNFKNISERLKNLLNGFGSYSYVNMLTLVNYNDTKYRCEYDGYSIFYEYKKKFKNIYSQLLFFRGYNDNYISFTRYCSGFARNFIYFLPIDLDIDKKSSYKNKYYCHEPYENEKYKIENYISNYSFKAFPYILTYLKENMDKTKSKKLEDLSGWVDSNERGFRAFVDGKIEEYLSKYKDSDLKPEKKETIHAEKKNITNLDAIYQIPYPSFLKDDILLFLSSAH